MYDAGGFTHGRQGCGFCIVIFFSIFWSGMWFVSGYTYMVVWVGGLEVWEIRVLCNIYTIKYEVLFAFCFVILNTYLFWFVGSYFYSFLKNYLIYFHIFHLFSPMFIYVHLFSIFIYFHLFSSIVIYIHLYSPTCQSIYLFFFFFVSFFCSFFLSIDRSIDPSIYLSVYLSICLSVCLAV